MAFACNTFTYACVCLCVYVRCTALLRRSCGQCPRNVSISLRVIVFFFFFSFLYLFFFHPRLFYSLIVTYFFYIYVYPLYPYREKGRKEHKWNNIGARISVFDLQAFYYELLISFNPFGLVSSFLILSFSFSYPSKYFLRASFSKAFPLLSFYARARV